MSTPTEVAKMLTQRTLERAGQSGNDAASTGNDAASSPNEGTQSTEMRQSRNPRTQRTHRANGEGKRVLNDMMGDPDEDTLPAASEETEEEAELPATDDTIEGGDQDEGADEGDDEGEEGQEGGEEEAGAEEDESDEPHLELDEDYTLSVKVDGEEREVTLRELLDNYSHSGAADKRLQEATETLKEAKASRDTAVNDAEKVQQSIYGVIQQIDKALHTPLVNAPDERMKQTNPQQYLRHLEAYQQDQERIRQSKEALKSAFTQQGEAINEAREANRKEQFKLVSQNLAPLRNKETREQAMDDIVQAGKHFGFTDEEIASGIDHRFYLMAHAASQYLKSTKGKVRMSKGGNETNEGAGNGKPNRVMRSGKTKAQGRQTTQQKKLVALKKQAQKSGKPNDVAAYLSARRKGA